MVDHKTARYMAPIGSLQLGRGKEPAQHHHVQPADVPAVHRLYLVREVMALPQARDLVY
jgi:hypothetical protein